MYLYHQGKHTRQAHVGIPEDLIEEEHGRQGFFGPVSHIYRNKPPLAWKNIEGNLKPRLFNFLEAEPPDMTDPEGGRVKLLYNNDIAVHVSRCTSSMPYYFRNADGDEVIFVHEGHGEIETDYGVLPYERGDYIYMPRATAYRIHCATGANFFLIMESFTEITPPTREMKGLIGEHALYDKSAATLPKLPEAYNPRKGQEHIIKIKRDDELTSVYYDFNPLNAVGWKGDLYPWKINVRDIRPIMSHRAHLPPPAHTSFVTQNAVICTFLPRPLEEDPEALRIPFFHSNCDYDEVIFYHDGDFFSRDNIDAGMVTLHPYGLQHGPHPKALKNMDKLERTNETAVMIDTYNGLKMTPAAAALENPDYWKSWMAYTEE